MAIDRRPPLSGGLVRFFALRKNGGYGGLLQPSTWLLCSLNVIFVPEVPRTHDCVVRLHNEDYLHLIPTYRVYPLCSHLLLLCSHLAGFSKLGDIVAWKAMKKKTVSLAPVTGAKGHTAMVAFRHLVLSFCLLRSTFSFTIDREEKRGKTAPCMRPGGWSDRGHRPSQRICRHAPPTPAPFYLANGKSPLVSRDGARSSTVCTCDSRTPGKRRDGLFVVSLSLGPCGWPLTQLVDVTMHMVMGSLPPKRKLPELLFWSSVLIFCFDLWPQFGFCFPRSHTSWFLISLPSDCVYRLTVCPLFPPESRLIKSL